MNPAMFRSVALPFLALTLVGCQSEDESAEQSLMATFEEMGVAIENGDLETFASHYSDSPLHLPPGASRNSSREEIMDFLEDKLGLYVIEGEPTVRFSDDATMAYVYGTYHTKVGASEGPESIGGRFITIWARSESDQWECVVDIWNTDDPRFAHL